MLLSKVIEHPELKKRDIVIIGRYTTDEVVFAVLARRGEKVFPLPKFFHLVENGPENPDPELSNSEVDSTLRRFGYFEPISTFPPK
jgi:hypothetical protein